MVQGGVIACTSLVEEEYVDNRQSWELNVYTSQICPELPSVSSNSHRSLSDVAGIEVFYHPTKDYI